MARTNRLLAVFLLLFFLQLCSATGSAVTPEQSAIAERVIQNVMSPYCPGKLLFNCPTAKASELKKRIFEMASHGKGYEEIVGVLYQEYGEETIRAVPEMTGFGAIAWLVPLGFLLCGGVGVGVYLTRCALRGHENR